MRLLLAEDERELSRAISAILKHHNYSVDAVYDGDSAEDYILTGIYDGVILDIMMPGKDGITVLKNMRSRKDFTLVILLTAKSEIDDRVLGLDSGADDYLTKPFASKELLARIRAMTRRAEGIKTNTMSFADLTLGLDSCELKSPTAQLSLPTRIFRLWKCLWRAQVR